MIYSSNLSSLTPRCLVAGDLMTSGNKSDGELGGLWRIYVLPDYRCVTGAQGVNEFLAVFFHHKSFFPCSR